MTGLITTCGGEVYQLPVLLAWEFSYTGGEPCDSFSVRCPYEKEMLDILRRAVRFTARENGTVRFFGVIDEHEAVCDEKGLWLELSGRGVAALLMDNEAEAVTYQRATASEILRRHVLPYGIRCGGYDNLSATAPYQVTSGSSEWKVLREFTRVSGGFSPYFQKDGTLLLTKERSIPDVRLDWNAPVFALRYKEKRYGVISEAVVIDKSTRVRQTVRNEDFYARGGQCRRVFYTPAHSGTQAMRYTGAYQIDRSKENSELLCVSVAARLDAQPEALVSVSGCRLGLTGNFRIREVVNRFGEDGETTELTMQRE